MGKLDGKVALVTGGAKGIGAAIVRSLAGEGAAVVVNYARAQEAAERVVAEIISSGGTALSIQADVSKSSDVERLFSETAERLSPVDIVVNNAGVFKPAPLEQFSEAEFHRHYNANVLGVFLSCQAAVKQFGDRGGNIINIGSAGVNTAAPTYSVYVSSKAAVNCLSRVLSKELAGRKIRVNCINPGLVETEGIKELGNFTQMEAAGAARTPLGRIGQPEDIGPVVAFLASDDARWITGEIIYVSGGFGN